VNSIYVPVDPDPVQAALGKLLTGPLRDGRPGRVPNRLLEAVASASQRRVLDRHHLAWDDPIVAVSTEQEEVRRERSLRSQKQKVDAAVKSIDRHGTYVYVFPAPQDSVFPLS
jgi:hypothetical protein